jgi:hypothetical protein
VNARESRLAEEEQVWNARRDEVSLALHDLTKATLEGTHPINHGCQHNNTLDEYQDSPSNLSAANKVIPYLKGMAKNRMNSKFGQMQQGPAPHVHHCDELSKALVELETGALEASCVLQRQKSSEG